MQATCDRCGTRHVLDDKQVAGSLRAKFRCSKCGEITHVEVAVDPGRTTPSVRLDAEIFVEPTAVSDQFGLALPGDKTICLTVLDGKSQGQSFTFDRPRVIVGRLGADFAVDDPEVSRWHCVIEVRGNEIQLRDLDSRNGTFVGSQRIRTSLLLHNAEFRVGNSRLRLTIQPR